MKNRPLTFKPELESIIRKCDVCSLAMVDENNKPYVLHMNFGYKDDQIFFHAAKTGKKIEILKKNPDVCVAFSTDHELRYVNEEVACSWGMKYRSVLAYGRIVFIDDHDEKVEALNIIMSNYSDQEFSYNKPAVEEVQPFKLMIEKLDGRAYGY
jgi:nitroimidazol reductase NimA-like FMN-containing flavoprotein (pyridoxamine 5'-phosphate oxidase superfamily)